MRRFVEGLDRGQATLFPECLEDWIDENNPVRVIDAFVDKLDLSGLGFAGVAPEATGRPSYHPSVLLKLYIYGYLNRVQSSRRLEREAGRNVEVLWLTCRLVPDHKTIADFRRDNGPAIKQVCVQFIELCRLMGLLTTASVAIDGSKFKAVNTRDKNFTSGKVERRRAQLEKSVARYLAQLDTADLQEPSEELAAKTAHLKEKLVKLESEMQRLAAMEKLMLASPDQQISLTDPDSRSMATSSRGSGVVGYNVQVAVDTKHHLIVAHEVTNEGSDRAQLANIACQAKEALGVDELQAVADRGYFNSDEILACDKTGITVTLPKPMTSNAKAEGRFGKQDFRYLAEDDVYVCPAGEKLSYHCTNEENGLVLRRYWTNACQSCAIKQRCTHRGDLDAAFRAARDGQAQAVNVFSSPFLASLYREIIDRAAEYRLPTIYQWREHAEAGGLMSYGPSLPAMWEQDGAMVARVLKGAKPSDLPVEQPTKFELVINLKTAKVLSLTISRDFLLVADEVIE